MTSICFYFQVHQPSRLRRIQCFNPPEGVGLWDEVTDRAIFERAADKCYLPANRLMLDLIERTGGAFRIAYSISGVFLEQAQKYRPDVVESFRELARTGHVEFLDETYYHSLSGLWDDPTECIEQIKKHRRLMQRLFGQSPTVFRNTELVYDDRIASMVERLGYKAILTEGTEKILGDRSPNHVYRPRHAPGLRVLLKNYKLSDDVAFRFSTVDWKEYPLTADKYADWLASCQGDTINLFMDYETFGEHQWPETGIFDFLRHLPDEVARHPHLGFALPREVVAENEPVGDLVVPHAISWADSERDVSAWLDNRMQQTCFERLKALAPLVQECGDPQVLHAWRLLQTSDHLYYACTKWMGDGAIHSYFSPYDSPYVAYINLMNAIDVLTGRAQEALERSRTRGPVEVVEPATEAPARLISTRAAQATAASDAADNGVGPVKPRRRVIKSR